MIKSWCWLIHLERAIIMNRTGLSTLAMSSVHYRQTSDVRPRCDEKSTRSSFRSIRGDQSLAVLLDPHLLSTQLFLSFVKGIGVLGDGATAIDFALDQGRIFQHPNNLIPYKLVQMVLPDRTIRAHRSAQSAITI